MLASCRSTNDANAFRLREDSTISDRSMPTNPRTASVVLGEQAVKKLTSVRKAARRSMQGLTGGLRAPVED